MRSVPTRGKRGTKRAVACDSSSASVDYFYKDGRRIQVGDCALFESPPDSPHSIGIIRWFSSKKEDNLYIGVNKLYRPVELKLGEGIQLDALPNEVFYSFYRHEIPAKSLLHPCKIAFLPKGVQLPSGKSSFICRRIFDADNRCLQWLTDQDFIDERQEEVDQLLYKTRIEMHATIQTDGRSPRPINNPTQISQIKSNSDNAQTTTPVPSQAKGRKRERTDQGSEPIKRERSLKADDRESAQFKSENILKFEISRITEKGGLVNSEGVEKLVQLMQPNKVDKKTELINRSIFAGVIAATENFDCLSRFVQLKGLPILDQWLQDVHKGKVRDGSPKENDKSLEEFLFILLRALDKLPVNLQALQMCNIGKSVNHLRTCKNSDIQKKARSLVDTWKKRVEAEMNVDTKSCSNQAISWPPRPRSSEDGIKSSAQISSAKIILNKTNQAEINTKIASNTREERSSGSSQSHNSQSCSISVNKVSVGSSRPRRSVGSSKNNILHKNVDSEKLSQSEMTCEKALDAPNIEGSSHKLIVKIPNKGRSPAQSGGVEPIEDPNFMKNRDSSPVISEKNDKSDTDSKEKADVKTESWESNDFKDILTGSEEVDGSPAAIEEDAKLVEISKNDSEILENEMKSVELQDASFSSINALIESCVKYSQVDATVYSGDDGGMNLLASVAAGEMSNLPSPDGSSGRTSNNRDEPGMDNDSKSSAPEDNDPKQKYPISVVSEKGTQEDAHDSPDDKIKNIASISSSQTSAVGKVLIGVENMQIEEKAEMKIEPEILKDNNINIPLVDEIKDKVDEIKREASVGVPSNPLLDVDGEKKADVREADEEREGCNSPCKESSSKLDDVKIENKKLKIENKVTCEEPDESKKIESRAETSHVNKKPKFDLNEGFGSDDGKLGYPTSLGSTGYISSANIINPLPFPVSSISSALPASVTVAAAAKGPFIPPLDLLKTKRELGWKGSAATSAFRPAEPRKISEIPPKKSRPVFDFDLNVADDIIVEDLDSRNSPHEAASTSARDNNIHEFPLKKHLPFPAGFDLDLNRVDEASDTWQGGTESHFPPNKKSSKIDFDLNDGPGLDESFEPLLNNQHSINNINIQSQPFSSWFPGNSFPPIAIPSIIAANGPARVLGPPTGSIPFGPDLYRGSVLSSSPAIPFPNFQYPVFPFGTGFPLPSVSLSNTYTDSVSNGRLGVSASNPSHFPRPYVVTSLPDGTGNNVMNNNNNNKWVRQGLDLNSGPGSVDMEVARVESRNSQAIVDEQGRMFQQMTGGILKKRENSDNFRYKQPSWQ